MFAVQKQKTHPPSQVTPLPRGKFSKAIALRSTWNNWAVCKIFSGARGVCITLPPMGKTIMCAPMWGTSNCNPTLIWGSQGTPTIIF